MDYTGNNGVSLLERIGRQMMVHDLKLSVRDKALLFYAAKGFHVFPPDVIMNRREGEGGGGIDSFVG